MSNEKIKKRILARVYISWFIKRVIPLIIIQVLALAMALKLFAKNVFISRVLQNASVAADSGYLVFSKYLLISFLNTRPIIQTCILVGLGIGALLIRDFIRSLMTYRAMWIKR